MFTKVNHIELNSEYMFVSVSVPEAKELKPNSWLGIDLNTTGHVAVMANPETGAVTKLGKSALHIHNKYKNIRRKLQRQGKYKLLKRIKNRESRIVKDMNHKISKKIVDTAKGEGKGIRLEKLEGIQRSKKHRRSFRYALHSWSFYQLQSMIEYKAKLLGVPIEYVDPAYTSQMCSCCGILGQRKGKVFKCPECGHVDHADANAAFNIAARPSIDRFIVDRDAMNGCTGHPEAAMVRMLPTVEPPML
jgi:putative transposase